MNHARWREVADNLCEINVSVGDLLSKMSHSVMPDWEIIKKIEKSILKKTYGIESTEEMKPKHIEAMMNYWKKGLGEGWGIELSEPEDHK